MSHHKFGNCSLHDRTLDITAESRKFFLIEKSHTLKKVENEVEFELGQCKLRRAHRQRLSEEKALEVTGSKNMVLKYQWTEKALHSRIPKCVFQSYSRSQNLVFHSREVKSHHSREDGKSKSVRFIPSIMKTSILPVQDLSHKSIYSKLTYSAKMRHFKDELSESHMLSLKIKKHDLQEIMNHLSLCYTYQVIDMSNRVPDKTWSGSDDPCNDDVGDFVFVGGYGGMDGVTECNGIHLAARRYQNIDFNNDEAVDALSHMYSMSHLLDGVESKLRKDSKRAPIRIISNDDSDNSESSSLISF